MILIRLCPVLPFITLNLLLSITTLAFKDYLIGGLGLVPGLTLRIFIGTTLSTLANTSNLKNNPLVVGMLVIGSALAIGGIVYISIITRRHLKQMSLDEENEKE